MYLKSVEINGFKSFADKIKLDFNPGITSIVGPNGSGKSNILDAILWVLGEQSYKNIRAKESRDVIFAGGKNKSSHSSVTVSLYINNQDKSLDIDSEIIKITRKLNIKSENRYYINDTKCRLKDINELFLDTGVGKSAYSVIGQGKVGQIIGSSSKEIKSIIEEAAGIQKIKLRKNEGLKKLDKIQIEIDKINLIIAEIKENKDKIEKQSKKAIKHKNLSSEIAILKKSIYMEEYKIAKTGGNILHKNRSETNLLLENLERDFFKKENNLEKINQDRINLSSEIERLTNENINLKKSVDKLINDKVLFSERIKGFNREIKHKDDIIKKSIKKIENQTAEINELNSQKDRVLEQLKKLELDNLEFENRLVSVEKIKKNIESEIEIEQKNILSSEMDKLKLVMQLENSKKDRKNSEDKILILEEEIVECNDKLHKLSNEIALLCEKKKQLTIDMEKIDSTIEKSENSINRLSEEMNIVYDKKKEIDFNFNNQKTKLEHLKKIDANNEGFFKGVKTILESKIEGVHGAFMTLVNIPEELQIAVESAVSGSLQDIIVKNSSVAKHCISYLKEIRGGRASFLAFDTINTTPSKKINFTEGILGYASDLVQYDSNYKKPVELILGNLMVVESISIALKLHKEKKHSGNIVTLSGELLTKRGRMSGGQYIKSASSLIFERKKNIKTLNITVNELEKKHIQLEKQYLDLSKKLEQYEKKLENIDDIRSLKDSSLREIKKDYVDLDERHSALEKTMKLLRIDRDREKNYISEYNKKFQDSSSYKFNLEESINVSQSKLDILNKNLINHKKELDINTKSYSNIKINFLNKKEQIKQLTKEIQKNSLNLEELNNEKNSSLLESEELNLEIGNINNKLYSIEKKFLKENIKYKTEFSEIKEKKKLQEQLEKSEKHEIMDIKNIEKDIIKVENKMKIIIEKVEKTKNHLYHIEEKLNELLSIEEKELGIDIENGKKTLRNLEEILIKLGDVNLLAIKEFEELTKKYEFVSSQRDDLLESKNSLLTLIKEIGKIIETKFYTAYKTINKNFDYMCKEVLNNSTGRLQLVTRENILESGIDLMVKFKNKKTQSMTLLSGGEKSMVAIALIMALFMYKPSPFTFFDEIEAALDETNIKKLIHKLKEFTDRSQFILITHNKETMRRSDTLYGVTMNKELGESKLISVSI